MRAIAGTLSDQDMADVAAYYESSAAAATPQCAGRPAHAAPRRRPQVAKLLDARRNCVSCHGANFSTPIDPSYPKLAGQHADYLYVALKAYQTDHNPLVGRNNAIMMGMARPFTHAEIKAIADYLALAAGRAEDGPAVALPLAPAARPHPGRRPRLSRARAVRARRGRACGAAACAA